MTTDDSKSLGDAATFAGHAQRRPAAEMSLGDARTLGGGGAELDTMIDDIEVVDIETRYKVEGTLGQGGMGAVLLATDTRLDRKVAIKRILGEAAGNRMAVQRFLTEAKAIAALNHSNIIQIYDYGRAKDGPFLIMEYVDGGSLLDRCRESALPLEAAIDLACQVCDGLAKAHDLGIIHRDIKPANVLLTKDGIPKLTDFGLAKAQAGDHGQTMTGAVLGTPDFMPPEQRRDAAEVDHRSDLWSLAATVYQMVTGRSPKIIRFKDVPESIQTVLEKALEDRKDDRYQTARELRDALKAARGGPASAASKAATASAITDELQEGQCRACGTVNADLTRKFCKKCGGALRAACLGCSAQVPVWDTICGECGGNQPQMAMEAEHVAEAVKHVAAFDYPAAIKVLESIPQAIRSSESTKLLADCRERQEEANRLVADIAGRIKRKELAGLLPLVKQAFELRGDRQDLAKILRQLRERRDISITWARKALASGDLRRAAAALSDMSPDERGEDGGRLFDQVQRAMALKARLVESVAAAKSDGVVTPEEAADLLGLCQEYLAINPNSENIQSLATRCRGIAGRVFEGRERARILPLPPLRNSLGMELKLLPPGTFTMGGQGSGSDETPHQVTLTRPFYIGLYEVTNALWKCVMGGVPSYWKDDNRPVENVSWEDAVDFCRKLSALPEEQKAGREYRLPTEAEWEYACRAGTITLYSFGDDESRLVDYGWFTGNSGHETHPVGMKKPNPWGLYDMHGNLWEWCSDSHGKYPPGAVTDPQGPSGGSSRVCRGGCWDRGAGICRSALRNRYEWSTRNSYVGFRLALSSSGVEPPEVGGKRAVWDGN